MTESNRRESLRQQLVDLLSKSMRKNFVTIKRRKLVDKLTGEYMDLFMDASTLTQDNFMTRLQAATRAVNEVYAEVGGSVIECDFDDRNRRELFLALIDDFEKNSDYVLVVEEGEETTKLTLTRKP